MTNASNLWQDPERIVELVGLIISIISIIVNIFQWITNRSIKKTTKSVLQSAHNAFDSILKQSSELKNTHIVDQDSLISGIHTNAERGKDNIENTLVIIFDEKRKRTI